MISLCQLGDLVEDVEVLEPEIEGLHQKFNSIKDLTIRGLEKCHVAVITVVYILTSIQSQEHRVFLKENHKALRQCEDHLELFGSLNFYWNYLAYDLLDHLIGELVKKHNFLGLFLRRWLCTRKNFRSLENAHHLICFVRLAPFHWMTILHLASERW